MYEGLLKKHIEVVHRKIKKFSCTYCGKMFAYDYRLNTHVKQVHEDSAKKHMCDKCDKSFFQLGKLKFHISAVHEKIKPYQCDQCASAFAAKQTLRGHIRVVHEKIKPFVCELCGKSYGAAHVLKDHACKLLPQTNIPTLCPICQKFFKNAVTQNSHMKQKHNITAKNYAKINGISIE